MQTKPTFGNGKICYLEIPSRDIKQSAAFYKAVFNWQVREDAEGNPSFDDGVSEVSGMWVTGREPVKGNSLMISVMVTDLELTSKLIVQNGGLLIDGASGPADTVQLFRDPSENIFCLYKHAE